jgi:DNA-binding NtrC family response regulator
MASDTTNGPLADGKPSIRRCRLLVVREDLADPAACRAFFEKFGYQVVACSSQEQAARSLRSEVFDFVLLNQGSPRLNWRGVLEHAIAVDRRTPVLVVTRCIDMPSYLDAMQLGAIDYVEEPPTRSELVRLLEAYLRPQARASQHRKEYD